MHNQVKSVQNSSKLGDFDVRDIREITFSLDNFFYILWIIFCPEVAKNYTKH